MCDSIFCWETFKTQDIPIIKWHKNTFETGQTWYFWVWIAGLYVNTMLSSGKRRLCHKKSVNIFVRNTPTGRWIINSLRILQVNLVSGPVVCTGTIWENSECRFLLRVKCDRTPKRALCVGVLTRPGQVNNALLSQWVGSWPRPWEREKKKISVFLLKLLNSLGRVTSPFREAKGGRTKVGSKRGREKM